MCNVSLLTVAARALFIQPKYARVLDTRRIREMLGEPSESREPINEGAVAPVPLTMPDGRSTLGEGKA